MDLNGLYKFFQGRYGIDKTFYVLAVIQMILIVLGSLMRIIGFSIGYYALYLVQILLLIFMIYRVFSKNTVKRSKENEFVTRTLWKLYSAVKGRKSNNGVKNDSSHDRVMIICPSCNANIRVKNIKGSHGVICPRCGKSFDVNI